VSRATIRERAQIKYHGLRPRYEDNACADCDYFVNEFKDTYGFTHRNYCKRKVKKVDPSHAACRDFAYKKTNRRREGKRMHK
jgi:hypothetical protein